MENIRISVITSDDKIAKCYPSTPNYQAGKLVKGTYKVCEVPSINALYNIISECSHKQALMLGVPKNNTNEGVITTLNMREESIAIARCKDDIDWSPNGKSFLLIDIDDGDVPDMKLNLAEDVKNLLIDYDNQLAETAMLIVPSSSQKYNTAKKSWHVYIACTNVSLANVKRYKTTLQSIAWNKGHGSIKVSKAGSLLIRQSFDMAVFSPERLILESVFSMDSATQFHTIDPLIQEGILRDLSIPLATDIHKSNRLISLAKMDKRNEAYYLKENAKKEKFDTLLNTGYLETQAKIFVKQMFDDRLIPAETVICLNEPINGNLEYTAGYIKVNTSRFRGAYCADPFYMEEGTSKAYITQKGNIYSYKQGGYTIELAAEYTEILNKISSLNTNETIESKKALVKEIQYLCSSCKLSKEQFKKIAQDLKYKNYLSDTRDFVAIPQTPYEVNDNGKALSTDTNLDILLEKKNYTLGYDVIKKEVTVSHPGLDDNIDNVIDTALSAISSDAQREKLPKDIGKEHLRSIAMNKYSYNPLTTMIEKSMSKYDGETDYIQQLASCFNTNASNEYVYEILKRWLIQCPAAWYHDKDVLINPEAKLKFENVLCLLGAQGLNKTKLLSGLLDFQGYDKYFKEGVKLSPSDKDSVKQAVSYGIVELGEIDATFRKSDVAELKAFFSNTTDELRLPYDRATSKYKRRTVFAATVNEQFFLADSTGNRRYWVLDLISIDFDAFGRIDKEGLWGQVGKLFFEGHKWWFDAEDTNDKRYTDEIQLIHSRHQQTTIITDIVHNLVERSNSSRAELKPYSPSEILRNCEIANPNKVQINELKSEMRKANFKVYASSGQINLPADIFDTSIQANMYIPGISSRIA